ncbi:MAG: GTA-gp10 family protein [Sphingomonadales bacterium]
MVNRARGEATISLDGTNYRVCADFNALAEMEDGMGLDCLDELGPRLERPRAKDIIVCLGALIRAGGGDISDREIGAMLTPASFADVLEQLHDAIGAAFGEPENPTRPPAKKRSSTGRK